jgi:hypothetical protein
MKLGIDVSPQELWNCPGALEFHCPAKWAALDATADPDVRHCPRCGRDVHWSPTPADFVRHGEAGRCVAIPAPVAVPQVVMHQVGQPEPAKVRAVADEQRARAAWWAAVFSLGPTFDWPGLADARDEAFPRDREGDTSGKATSG